MIPEILFFLKKILSMNKSPCIIPLGNFFGHLLFISAKFFYKKIDL